MMSIERIDNTKGYVKTNVVLICSEFNSTDTTVMDKNDASGSSQWNKDKINILMETIAN